MRTYKLWLEIEEYDDEKDEYENREGVAIGTYKDEEKTIEKMYLLESIGKLLWPESN